MTHDDYDAFFEPPHLIEPVSDQRGANPPPLLQWQDGHRRQARGVHRARRRIHPHAAEQDVPHRVTIHVCDERRQDEPVAVERFDQVGFGRAFEGQLVDAPHGCRSARLPTNRNGPVTTSSVRDVPLRARTRAPAR